MCSLLGYQSNHFSPPCNVHILSLDGIGIPRSKAPSVTSPPNSIYYTNLTCPPYITSIADCYANRTMDEACLSGEQEYFVTCFNGNALVIMIEHAIS